MSCEWNLRSVRSEWTTPVCASEGGSAWRGRRRGFTLIELLVVIAIIALLVSMLLPSLRRARLLTYDTICLSHLHEIATGIQMYASEHNRYYPYDAWGDEDSNGEKGPEGWMTWWYRVGRVVGTSSSNPSLDRIWQNGYVDWRRGNYEEGVWKCPTAQAQITPQWHWYDRWDNHYGMNGHLLGSMQRSAPWTVTCHKVSEFPPDLVLVADSHIGWYQQANGGTGGYYFWDSLSLNPYWYAYDAWPLQLESRDGVPNPFAGHTGNKANVARIDGSAAPEKELTWQDFMVR